MIKRMQVFLLSGMLMMLLCVNAFAASPEARFVVTGPERSPEAGEEVSVAVSLEDNPGFSAMQFTLAYDEETLECTAISAGEKLRGTLNASNPNDTRGASISAATLDPVAGDGILANCTFRVKKANAPLKFELIVVDLSQESGEDIPYTTAYAAQGGSAPAKPPEDIPANPPASDPADKPENKPTPPAAEPTAQPTTPPAPPTEPESPSPQETAPAGSVPSFPDAEHHWGREYIARAASLGLFSGYPDGNFHPDTMVTRAQFVAVLWRMAGSPAATADAPFTDMQGQVQAFQEAVNWAYGQGYVSGTSATSFSPDVPLTRQEVMTILYRYSGAKTGMESAFTGIYDDAFHDHAEIAGWAKNAMYWGVYNELIRGGGDGTLSPTGQASRAQIATIVVMYTEKLGKEAK